MHAKGYLNKGFGSATNDQGLKMLIEGEAAHYAMLSLTLPPRLATFPQAATDIGFFGIPGDDPAKHGATIWEPPALYIAKTTEHLDAAKKFLAFVASPAGADAVTKAVPPAGPYRIEGATLPDDALQVAKDLQGYIDSGATAPALEFLSPVKGPSLEQITVAVGSGLTTPAEGAAQYDKDVEKQAEAARAPRVVTGMAHRQERRAPHGARPGRATAARPTSRARRRSAYPYALYVPAAVVYLVIFLVPTVVAFYFALTRWTLFDSTFVGLDNFRDFLAEQNLRIGFQNTLIYAVVTSGLKVVLGMALGVLLTSGLRLRGFLRSVVFFPVLVSTVAVGITFSVLLKPDTGLVDTGPGPGRHLGGRDWLGDADHGAAVGRAGGRLEGRGPGHRHLHRRHPVHPAGVLPGGRGGRRHAWHGFRHVTLPLSWPATYSVIILSFIGGLRSFDLIWTMTRGGPGFTSDTIASIIYKQYQAGFFGLSTAGNVLLFLVVTAIVVPLTYFLGKRQVDL